MSDTQELKKCPDAGLSLNEISKEIADLAKDGRNIEGTVYAALYRAEQRGLSRTTPEPPADKQRALDALDFEIKGLRKKASFIEARNPDGSLNEITHDMKVTALKLENRVLEPLRQALTEPQETVDVEALKASIENYLYAFHGFNDPDNEVYDILVAWTDHLTSKGIIKAQGED